MDDLDMESEFDLNLPIPSLRILCYIKTATSLWTSNKRQIQEYHVRTFSKSPDWNWRGITKIVKEKATSLGLPCILENELQYVVENIGYEIRSWLDDHYPRTYSFKLSYLRFDPEVLYQYLGSIRWTIHGMINRSAMVRAFVKDPRLDILQRYRMACQFCFEDSIRDLWPEFEISNEHMLNETPLVKFWCNQMKTKTKIGIDASVFQYSLDNYFFEAVKDFWERMSQEERAENLLNITQFLESITVITSKNLELFLFLFQKLGRQSCSDLFKDRPKKFRTIHIGYMLTVWPFKLFMEVSKPWLDLLTAELYLELLKDLTWYNDGGLMSAFRFCWEQARPDVKAHLTKWENFTEIFKEMVIKGKGVEDYRFKLLLNILDCFDDKELLVLTQDGLSLCKVLLRDDKTTFLKPYLEICVNSRTAALNLLKAVNFKIENIKKFCFM